MSAFVLSPLFDSRSSNIRFIESKIAAAESARRARIQNECGTILDSKHLDSSRIAELAQRDNYAFAFDALARLAKLNEAALAALIEPAAPTAAAFRAARAFGVIPARSETPQFGIDNLHAIGTEKAACALAALGEIRWCSASRRVRAVYCLRALIEARRS